MHLGEAFVEVALEVGGLNVPDEVSRAQRQITRPDQPPISMGTKYNRLCHTACVGWHSAENCVRNGPKIMSKLLYRISDTV